MKTETKHSDGLVIVETKNDDGSITTVTRWNDGSFELHQIDEYEGSTYTNLKVDFDSSGHIGFCAASDGFERGSVAEKDLPLLIELLSRMLRLASEK